MLIAFSSSKRLKKRDLCNSALTLFIALLLATAWTRIEAAGDPLELQVVAKASQEQTTRIGINLGGTSWWGANQYLENIVPQPGFEGYVDRTVLIINKIDEKGFYAEHGPSFGDGYWSGATYDIRSGNSAGKTGEIQNSFKQDDQGIAYYIVDGVMPELSPKDVIIVTKVVDDEPLIGWWISKDSEAYVHPDTNEKAPSSKGVRSMRLDPPQGDEAKIISYFDTIKERAGKLLQIDGRWKLSFWAKADKEGTRISVRFARLSGVPPFLEKEFTLTTEWQEYSAEFSARDDGPAENAQLLFTAHGKLWLDDVWLGFAGKENQTFRDDLVTMLKQLKPSFLRNWQDQLSDTLENELSLPSARRQTMVHIGGGNDNTYVYSLPEFLQLCEQVGANPWIIVPATYSDQELKDLGDFLKDNVKISRFPQVVLEFGNENWNWVYRYGGIPYPDIHGKVAERAYKIIKQEVGKEANIRYAVNGQHANPWLSEQYIVNTDSADTLAIAPYFLHDLNAGENPVDVVTKLMTEEDPHTKAISKAMLDSGKKAAYYEINFHTTEGTAKGNERNLIVAGAVSGTVLVQKLLQGMFLNYSPMMVHALTGFDYRLRNGEFVKLWGIARDVDPQLRLRPTGLGVEMLNKVIQGSLHAIKGVGTDVATPIFGAGFLGASGWTAALVSSSHEPQEILLAFPDDGQSLPTQALVLQAGSPFDSNEDEEKVKIVSHSIGVDGRKIHLIVPGWGTVVLTNN